MTSPARPPACAPAADDGKAPRTPAAWMSLTLSPGRKTLSRRGARMMSPLPYLVMFDLVPRAGHFKRAQVGHSCQAPKHCAKRGPIIRRVCFKMASHCWRAGRARCWPDSLSDAVRGNIDGRHATGELFGGPNDLTLAGRSAPRATATRLSFGMEGVSSERNERSPDIPPQWREDRGP